MVIPSLAEKQRALSVRAMQNRMQHNVLIAPNPLNNPHRTAVYPGESALWDYMETVDGAGYNCNVSRNSRAQLESGTTPSDDDVGDWDVVIPGGVGQDVLASYLVIVRGYGIREVQDPNDATRTIKERGLRPAPEFEGKVFTIRNINQDYLKVLARLSMSRSSSR